MAFNKANKPGVIGLQLSKDRLVDIDRQALAQGQFGLLVNLGSTKFQKLGLNPGGDFDVELLDEKGNVVAVEKNIVVPPNSRMVKISFSDVITIEKGEYEVRLLANGNAQTQKVDVPGALDYPQPVTLRPTVFDDTDDENFWPEIIRTRLDFNLFQRFLDQVLNSKDVNGPEAKVFTKFAKSSAANQAIARQAGAQQPTAARQLFESNASRLPFLNVEEYSLVKFATEAFMRHFLHVSSASGYFNSGLDLPYYS
ncbi:MAG: hypothetical protein AAB316_10165, partial [Bacteroidota bacterium]